jgi:hypothetical protein
VGTTGRCQQEGAMAGAAKPAPPMNAITSKIKASLADQKQIGVTTRRRGDSDRHGGQHRCRHQGHPGGIGCAGVKEVKAN